MKTKILVIGAIAATLAASQVYQHLQLAEKIHPKTNETASLDRKKSFISEIGFKSEFGFPNSKTKPKETEVDKDWYAETLKNLKTKEYNISYNKEKAVYQSPNRNNNLRFYYKNDGFSVQPRDTKILLEDSVDGPFGKEPTYKIIDDWQLTMQVKGYGRKDALIPLKESEIIVNENKAVIDDKKIEIHYENNEAGMRQDFIVKQKPAGTGFLNVSIDVQTDLLLTVGADAATFKNKKNGEEVMKYSSLKVWDADGVALRGWMEKSKEGDLLLVVNDEKAKYPVTIDPLSSSAVWTSEGNVYQALMGSCITAGNFNGDQYSDVAISLPGYDYLYPAEGAVFVFNGTASGLTGIAWSMVGTQSYAHVGNSPTSMSSGDFNGDGYSDLAVGIEHYDSPTAYEGLVCVYMGSSSGLSATWGDIVSPALADWDAQGDLVNGYFGNSVSSGDFNGDGYGDIVIGAKNYSNGTVIGGGAFVWYGSSAANAFGADDTAPGADWYAHVNQSGANFGNMVSGAGDVNGDGYGDLLVGAYLYDGPATNSGGAFVWAGSASGLSGSSGSIANSMWTATGNVANDYMGTSVCRAGDADGNGCGDIIVGVPGYESTGLTDEGIALVWYGSVATDLGADGTILNADWKIKGGITNEKIGVNVSLAGDVNGDGYSDVMIGSVYHNIYYGMVSVYNGSKTGLSTTASWSTIGTQQNAEFGAVMSSAGDINGDGYSDIMLGASKFDNGHTDEGKVFLYYGSAGGLANTNSWAYRGNQTNGQFGYCMSYAGDVNGDGYSDVIIASPYYDNGHTDEGKIWVYCGSANGLLSTAYFTAESDNAGACFGISVDGAGDVDKNGYADIIVGAPFYTGAMSQEGAVFVWYGSSTGFGASGTPLNADWTATANQPSARFGTSVASAGDVNKDGCSDVIIGAPLYDVSTFLNAGSAWIWFGSATGLGVSGIPSNADWHGENFLAGSQYGYAVACAGDIRNDGFSDVIVGAPGYSNGQSSEGAVYQYNGSATMPSGTISWLGESNSAGALLGESISSAGDVNGDRYSDIICGAYGYSNGQVQEGAVFVWHGSATGLGSVPTWTAESNFWSASFGDGVSTAGDVNGDGYSDIIVGASTYANVESNEGAIFVWHGSATGLGASGTTANADWSKESNITGAELGLNVAGGGDVNGDGFGDVLSGARYANNHSITGAGQIFFYYGNEGPGLAVNARQMQTDFVTPLAVALFSGGTSGSNNTVGSVIHQRSFYGRMDIKVNREFYDMQLNTLLVLNTNWTDIGTAGIQSNEYGWPLPGYRIRWRQRFQYRLSEGGFQSYSHWYYLQDNGVTEEDFFTCALCEPNDNGERVLGAQGILSSDNKHLFTIAPNPNNGEFYLISETSGNKNIIIYDITGKIVYENKTVIDKKTSINLNDQPKGVYILRVIDGQSLFTQKIIKQ